MEYGRLLLLFDQENPCWTEYLARLAGEDPDSLQSLREKGLLEDREGVFFLTDRGKEAFLKEAEECFLPVLPGTVPEDPDKSLFQTRLRLLLDRKHLQRWGLKEYVRGARFPIPDLEADSLFSRNGGFEWKWPCSPAVERMRRDWPVTGLAARKVMPPPADAVSEWFEGLGERPGIFEADLLYLSRYDFQAYTSFAPLPGDTWGLLNADRFFCMKAPVPKKENFTCFLRTIGRFQLVLEVLRRMILPGYVDLDSHDQDGITWLVFLFETDDGAERCRDLLSPLGLDLIRPAIPMDVWALSFEALEAFPEKAETIHDLIPVIGKAVMRTP